MQVYNALHPKCGGQPQADLGEVAAKVARAKVSSQHQRALFPHIRTALPEQLNPKHMWLLSEPLPAHTAGLTPHELCLNQSLLLGYILWFTTTAAMCAVQLAFLDLKGTAGCQELPQCSGSLGGERELFAGTAQVHGLCCWGKGYICLQQHTFCCSSQGGGEHQSSCIAGLWHFPG